MAVASQNLVPNPSFEEVFTDLAHQWVQPQGAYYHYEKTDSLTYHQARTGQYVNGLCMYNNQENEFLHVKLLEPMRAGESYQISFYARLMRAKCFNAYVQKLIGVYFGSSPLSTHIPGDLYLAPQLNLELPDSNRFHWFRLEANYTAKGGEEYLTLGYFAATQTEEIRRAETRYDVSELSSTEESEKKDMSWLYMAPEEQKKYIKEQKKKSKKKKGDSENMASVHFEKPRAKKNALPETGVNPDIRYFQVRYYFDDFCLATIGEDGVADCSSEETPIVLKEGESITLRNVFFETSESELLKESVVQLLALKRILDDHPSMKIELRGYTDNRGNDSYNMELSEARAKAVKDWLIEYGIEAQRLTSRGFGRKDPIESNETKAGRARNRRVEFFIVDM